MPAGDLVLLDWHVEVQALLHGPGTVFMPDRSRGAIRGLGRPPAKTADVELHQADGSYGSPDHSGVRVLSFAWLIKASTAAAAMNALDDLNAAWAPVSADVPLYARLPGWGKFHLYGRPRAVDEDISHVQLGIIPVLCRFDALDPAIVFD